jgi:hypothetical protein
MVDLMAAPQALLKNCQGLHVGVDSLRVKYDVNSGATFLAACSNVTVDRGGRLSRRKGAIQKSAVAGKDIFSDGIDCLVHRGSDLLRMLPDYSMVGLRSGLNADAEMFFAASPRGIFYSNGIERGRVERGGASFVWIKPSTNYEPVHDLTPYGPPDGLTHIHYHLGHLLCAVENVMHYSDYGSYNVFYPERDIFQYRDQIIGFASAKSTPFVFTETGVYAHVGETLGTSREVFASNVPAIQGTIAHIQSVNPALNALPIWLTRRGLYIGLPNGEARILTENRLILPDDVFKGKAVCHNGQYVAILQR